MVEINNSMYEIIFLVCFTLHNIEELIWLPGWSKNAGKYHPQVKRKEFGFALAVVTLIGYFLTFAFLNSESPNEIIRYLYLGFVMMMCLNAVFPHLIAAVVLKRYAPGLLTGLLLNLPAGLYVVFGRHGDQLELNKLAAGFAVCTVVTVFSLRPLFKLGRKLFD